MATREQAERIAKVAAYYGLKFPVTPVCKGHSSPAQIAAMWYFDRPPITLAHGPRGGGKAQPIDSLVQTPGGPVRMGEIRVGDEVCTPDGGIARVSQIHPQGLKQVYRISFRDGDSVECCADHLWEVHAQQRQWRRPKVVSTAYIIENCHTPSRGDCNFSIRLPEPLQFRPGSRDFVIPPYTMGVLIGDGCLRWGRPTFTTADPEIVEFVQGECHRDLAVKPMKTYAYAIGLAGRHGGNKRDRNHYKVELERLGLWRMYSHEKHIPREYLYASIEDRWSLIRGLMDTDGYIDNRGHVSYCTSSPMLAKDFKFLVESLGGLCVIREKITKCRLAYNCYIKYDRPAMLFRLSRKKARGLPRTKYPAKRIITSVDPIGFKVCQCITLDSVDGLYLTDNCVVTHNSLSRGFIDYLLAQSHKGFKSRILGGSLAQAMQIYNALDLVEKNFREKNPGGCQIPALNKQKAVFFNGSEVEILAASTKQVRGPHVCQLNIDEADEVDPEIMDDALPMAMAMGGLEASISLTSTWHRVGGPMAELTQRIPTYTFCAFDILERCPDERSGPDLEGCEECPLKKWCHSDRHLDPLNRPKAKRSNGHYTIQTLITQLKAKSLRSFESDFLSLEPRAAGMWFTAFDDDLHVSESAEYDRNRPFHVSIDPGVCTGAVWFQAQKSWDGTAAKVNVFGDYYAEGLGYEQNARAILQRTQELTGLGMCYAHVSMDPAAEQRSAAGVIARTEYARAGVIGRDLAGAGNTIMKWPFTGNGHPKADALGLIEALLLSADGSVSLTIHPRCKGREGSRGYLVDAFKNYLRKKATSGAWLDQPMDEQHPWEDLIDPLVGGVRIHMPEGRKPDVRIGFRQEHAARI